MFRHNDDRGSSDDDQTHLRNCGRSECHELLSCFSVRYSSKVETVLGSHLMVPIRLHTWSFSKLMKRVHPLKHITVCLWNKSKLKAGASIDSFKVSMMTVF